MDKKHIIIIVSAVALTAIAVFFYNKSKNKKSAITEKKVSDVSGGK